MSSMKQIQNRIQIKKNSINKVNTNIAHANSSKNKVILRRLNQEKDLLARDIRKLERQLVTLENQSRRMSGYR